MDELDFTKTLHDHQFWCVYLITYSEANLVEFPTCGVFVEKVLKFFTKQKDDKNPLLRWSTICCQEPHAEGGKHYHMVISFQKPQKWMPVKKYMIQNFGINLHFSSQNLGYVAAYKYICKGKSTDVVLLSPDHVNLNAIGSPRTKNVWKLFQKMLKSAGKVWNTVKHHARQKVKEHI